MSSPTRNPVIRVSDRVYTTRAVQPQKLRLENLKYWNKRGCNISVAKTKKLISCTVTAQLICAFFWHMQKACRFPHDVAHKRYMHKQVVAGKEKE